MPAESVLAQAVITRPAPSQPPQDLLLLPLTSCSARTQAPAPWGRAGLAGLLTARGRIGRPSCGGVGRSVTCSGPGISAALDLPEDQPSPGIPRVKAAQGIPADLDLRRTLPAIWNGIRNPPAGGARDPDRPHPQPPQQVGGLAAVTQPGQRRWPAGAPTPASPLAGARPGQSLPPCRPAPRDCASDPTRTLRTTCTSWFHDLLFGVRILRLAHRRRAPLPLPCASRG